MARNKYKKDSPNRHHVTPKTLAEDIYKEYVENENTIIRLYRDKFKIYAQKWIRSKGIDLYYGFMHEYPKGSEFEQPDFDEWVKQLMGVPNADRRFYKNGGKQYPNGKNEATILSVKVQRAARGSAEPSVFRGKRRTNKGLVLRQMVHPAKKQEFKDEKKFDYIAVIGDKDRNPEPLLI